MDAWNPSLSSLTTNGGWSSRPSLLPGTGQTRSVKPVSGGTSAGWSCTRRAVNSFAVALDVAEREARRIRDSKFTGPERERLATARQLLRIAGDHAATPAERQAAYKRARRELDGLIVLPDAAVAALEAQVAPGLDAGREPSDFRHR